MHTLNKVRQYNCDVCHDERVFEICDASTDALIGWRKCEDCPPFPPIFKALRFWESGWKMSAAERADFPPF